jgi:hydrogenase-4 component F
MAFAAVFMVRQRDFKRMLAYSSVEHMGILVIGIGIGGNAYYGAMLHLINNALTKGVLFLSAGNIHRVYDSKFTDNVRGALQRVPLSAGLFLAGFFAITGSPPFGPFVSEFTIVRATFAAGDYLVGGIFLLLLGIIFIGMGATVLKVVQGTPPENTPTTLHDTFATCAPIVLCMSLVLLLGLYIPAPLENLLQEAKEFLERYPR